MITEEIYCSWSDVVWDDKHNDYKTDLLFERYDGMFNALSIDTETRSKWYSDFKCAKDNADI